MWSVQQISSIFQRVIVVQFSSRPHLGFVQINGRGRPPRRPRARAEARPALVRSWIRRLRTGERREDMEDQLARWAGCINEAIAHRAKANAAIAQFLNQLDQMVHRTPESIKSPNDKRAPCSRWARHASRPGRLVLAPETLSVKISSWFTPSRTMNPS